MILEDTFMSFIHFQTLFSFYLQVQSLYCSLTPKYAIHRQLSDFEQLYTSVEPPTHTISRIYMLLSILNSPGLPLYTRPNGQWNLAVQYKRKIGITFLLILIHFQYLVIPKSTILNCYQDGITLQLIWTKSFHHKQIYVGIVMLL